jgi:hypothetical protein
MLDLEPSGWASIIDELIGEESNPFYDNSIPHTSIKLQCGPYEGKWIHIPGELSQENIETIRKTLNKIWSFWDHERHQPWHGLDVPYHTISPGHWRLMGPPCAPFPMTPSPAPPFSGPHTAVYNAGGHFNGWYLHVPRYLATDEMYRTERVLSEACQKPWDWGNRHGSKPFAALTANSASRLDVYSAQKEFAQLLEEVGVDLKAQKDIYGTWGDNPIWVDPKAPVPPAPSCRPEAPATPIAATEAPSASTGSVGHQSPADSAKAQAEPNRPVPALLAASKPTVAGQSSRSSSPSDQSRSDWSGVWIERPNDPFDTKEEYVRPVSKDEQEVWQGASERLKVLEETRKAGLNNPASNAPGRTGDWLGTRRANEYSDSASEPGDVEAPPEVPRPANFVGYDHFEDAREMLADIDPEHPLADIPEDEEDPRDEISEDEEIPEDEQVPEDEEVLEDGEALDTMHAPPSSTVPDFFFPEAPGLARHDLTRLPSNMVPGVSGGEMVASEHESIDSAETLSISTVPSGETVEIEEHYAEPDEPRLKKADGPKSKEAEEDPVTFRIASPRPPELDRPGTLKAAPLAVPKNKFRDNSAVAKPQLPTIFENEAERSGQPDLLSRSETEPVISSPKQANSPSHTRILAVRQQVAASNPFFGSREGHGNVSSAGTTQSFRKTGAGRSIPAVEDTNLDDFRWIANAAEWDSSTGECDMATLEPAKHPAPGEKEGQATISSPAPVPSFLDVKVPSCKLRIRGFGLPEESSSDSGESMDPDHTEDRPQEGDAPVDGWEDVVDEQAPEAEQEHRGAEQFRRVLRRLMRMLVALQQNCSARARVVSGFSKASFRAFLRLEGIIDALYQGSLRWIGRALKRALRRASHILGRSSLLRSIQGITQALQQQPFWNPARLARDAIFPVSVMISSYVHGQYHISEMDIIALCQKMATLKCDDICSPLRFVDPPLFRSVLQDQCILLVGYAILDCLPKLLDKRRRRNSRGQGWARWTANKLLETILLIVLCSQGMAWSMQRVLPSLQRGSTVTGPRARGARAGIVCISR